MIDSSVLSQLSEQDDVWDDIAPAHGIHDSWQHSEHVSNTWGGHVAVEICWIPPLQLLPTGLE